MTYFVKCSGGCERLITSLAVDGLCKDCRSASIQPPPSPSPPEVKNMAGELTTKFRCAVCGKLTAGRMPRRGDTSARYPRRHDSTAGTPCPGTFDEAVWVDVRPRTRDRAKQLHLAFQRGRVSGMSCGKPDENPFRWPWLAAEWERGRAQEAGLAVLKDQPMEGE